MRAIPSKRLMMVSFALMIGFAGCASGSGGGGGGSSMNRLTAEDMANQQELDLLQAVRQLRGRWLTSRGRGGPRVHVDGARLGGMQELQNIRVADVQLVEYMSAADATLRFGTGYDAGAIIVSTRRR